MCSHNPDKNRKEYTSPPHHITVPHRAQAQGNHCSEMQTTQLKMIQTLKPFLPEYFQQASLNKNPKLGRSDKPQTPLTRHSRQPGLRAQVYCFRVSKQGSQDSGSYCTPMGRVRVQLPP